MFDKQGFQTRKVISDSFAHFVHDVNALFLAPLTISGLSGRVILSAVLFWGLEGTYRLIPLGLIVLLFLAILFLHSQGFLSFILLVLTVFFMFALGPVLLAMVQELPADGAFLNGVCLALNFITAVSGSFLVGGCSNLWGMKFSFLMAAIVASGAIPSLYWVKTVALKEKRLIMSDG